MYKLLTALSLALLITTPAMAIENDDTLYFPAVAQGHSCTVNKNGKNDVADQLRINDDRVNIIGTKDKPLDFCSVEDDRKGACDGGKCVITAVTNRTPSFPLNQKDFFKKNAAAISFPKLEKGTYNLKSGNYYIKASELVKVSDLSIKSTGQVNIYVDGHYKLQDKTLYVEGNVDFYFDDILEAQDATFTVNGKVRFFVNKKSDLESANIIKELGSSFHFYGKSDIKIQGSSEVNGYVYTSGRLELQNSSLINGRVTANKLEMESTSSINDVSQGAVDKCFTDDFNRTTLGGEFWAVNKSKGNFTPGIVSNRFRLTEAVSNQATSITYTKLFPANNNEFVIEFDNFTYNGNAADGVALVLSDATAQPIPGAYGGPLGYGFKSDADGFNGAWLGIGIDEFGNFIKEGGTTNNKVQIKNTVAIRGKGQGKTGYNLLISKTGLNPAIHSGTSTNRPHRYRISIKFENLTDKARVIVERKTAANNSFDLLIDYVVDQGPIPENLIFTITGSTGTYYSVHEIDNTSICAARLKDYVPAIDHFRFDFKNKTLQSCQPEDVTLIACLNESCDKTYNLPIVANLAVPTAGMEWIGGSSINFSSGRKNLKLTGTGKTSISILSSNPGTTFYKEVLCQLGGGGYSAGNCNVDFSSKGKVFNLTIPDSFAGETIEATLEPLTECKALYAGIEKDISFTMKSIQPEVMLAKPDLLLTNNLSKYALNPSVANKKTITTKVKFDSEGKGKVLLLYPESGVNEITVSDSLISGAANFITIPKGLCVISEQGQCTAANTSCPPFKAAGENFTLKISAHGMPTPPSSSICTGPVLQNYMQDIDLTSNLHTPKQGQPGVLKVAKYTHNKNMVLNKENLTIENTVDRGLNYLTQSIDEVGVFSITAQADSDGHYYGSEKQTESFTSAPIGRFYPAKFLLDTGDVTAEHDGDKQQSFLGQDFNVDFSISAVNAKGDIVQNYIAGFDRAKVTLDGLVDNENKNVRLNNWNAKDLSSWINGRLDFNAITNFSRIEKQSPFWLDIKLNLDDGEQPHLSKLHDVRTDNKDAECNITGGCNSVLLGKHELRYGRLLAPTVQYASNEAASAPLQVQYWDGSKNEWQKFEKDNWTPLSIDNIKFSPDKFTNGTKSKLDGLTMTNGEIKLNVDAPGEAVEINYEVVLTGNSWLQFEKSNQGKIIFGSSKGNSSVIYRREQFLGN